MPHDPAASGAAEPRREMEPVPQQEGPETPPPAVPIRTPEAATPAQKDAEAKKAKKKKKKKKKDGLGSNRGIETMFRTSYRTHMDLSALADNKANIMISINGIMLTVMISVVVPNVYQEPYFLIPSVVLLITSLISIVFAVLCARPRVSSRTVSLDDVRENRANILFFGNFVNMRELDYEQGMIELMRDPERIYLNMTRDIYGLGKVLYRKFRLLRIAYTVFMFGLILTVLSYLAAFIWNNMSG